MEKTCMPSLMINNEDHTCVLRNNTKAMQLLPKMLLIKQNMHLIIQETSQLLWWALNKINKYFSILN